MPIPTHRVGCETRMFPTNCPDCGERVYYFSCSCGSKVFFNLPEPPWVPHEDGCIPYLIRYMIEIERVPESQIRSIVEEYSRTSGVPIPSDIRRRLDQLDNRGSNRLMINDVQPKDGPCPAMGIIISVSSQVNFFKRFNYSDNAMGRGLLGKLVRDSYVELVIREDPGEQNTCNRFNAFQKLTEFNRTGLGRHCRAVATLIPHQLADGRKVWMIQQIERVL